jgi:hypothetical protein
MLRRTFVTFAGLALSMAVVGACGKDTPATPTPPAPLHASISVSSISVTGERAASGGYTYRVVLHLRETGGAAATVSAVALTFANDAGVLTSARYDQVIPSTGNRCPANGTADTREFVTTDANAAHAFAQSVQAIVTYSDEAATAGTATGSASIPPLPSLPPVTHTLTGVITDVSTGVGIQGARVEALNGANAGKAATTDASGAYALTGLTAETFRMRASATGYDTGEQNVTVPDIPRADMALRRTAPEPCAYTVSPTGTLNVNRGRTQSSLAITRTSGTCGWTATTDVSWISLASTSGSGNATVGFEVRDNTTFVGRIGTITVEWSGGRSQLTVTQDADIPPFCFATIGNNPLSVPAAGGTYDAQIIPAPGMPPGLCSAWTATASGPAVTIIPPTGMGSSVKFSVAANGSTTPRTFFINVTFLGGGSTSLTINQAAGP